MLIAMMSEMQVLFEGMAQRQQQVVKAVIDYAQTRQIPVGGRLPSIRAIAEDTGITPATITKALQHLAQAEWGISAQGRHGTVLLQSMQKGARQSVRRIVFVVGLLGNVATSITGGRGDFEFRLVLKNLRPDLEVYSILHSGRENDDYLEDMIRYHTQMGREGGVVFVLGNCDEKVKQLLSPSYCHYSRQP